MLTTGGGYPVALLVHIAFVRAGLLIYVMGTHASGQRRHPSAALAWVLTITQMSSPASTNAICTSNVTG